ncbi:MAG: Stp1/IreP family PP2C-type Ser/Thr phosphatase [Nitrospirae bacterium]|nr:Stp1/IreP family PP2C-type Ser/Thr phosphatase [Nitrospirota bacterium]
MEIKVFGDTHTGLVRTHNEDALGIFPELSLYVVADGLGGHAGGEVASRLAVDVLRNNIISDYHILREKRSNLVSAIKIVNKWIIQEASKDYRLQDMGTTIVAVKLENDTALVAHVGDSRAYLIRDGGITQVTKDHTVVEDYIKAGLLTREEAFYSPYKSALSRALGTAADAEVDINDVKLRTGDTLILCTDGLTNMMSDSDILNTVKEFRPSPEGISKGLINLAIKNGGIDNITVIAICVME